MKTVFTAFLALSLAVLSAGAMAGAPRSPMPSGDAGCPGGMRCLAEKPAMSPLPPTADEADQRAWGESDLQRFDEYLSLHDQAAEGQGRFALMPWPGLRIHPD